MPGLDVGFEQRGDNAIVLKLVGRASAIDQNELEARADRIIEAKPRRLVVDLSELQFLGSYGISLLLRMHKMLRADGGEVRLAAPSPDVMNVIKQTRLDDTLPIFHDGDSAIG